jgi:ferredoxin
MTSMANARDGEMTSPETADETRQTISTIRDSAAEGPLPEAGRAPGEEDGTLDPETAMIELRRFHRGLPVETSTPPPASVLPALLHRFRGATHLRNQYPLFIAPAGVELGQDGVIPLRDLLDAAVSSFAPDPEECRILRDNLLRLETRIRDSIPLGAPPADAGPLLEEARRAMIGELGLVGENAAQLEFDLESLISAIPSGGRFLAYGEGVAVRLLLHVTRNRLSARREEFRREVASRADHLRALLDVERAKDPEARRPDELEGRMGSAASRFVSASRLSEVLGDPRGSTAMTTERRERISRVLNRLDGYLACEDSLTLVLVCGESAPAPELTEDDVRIVEAEDALAEALLVFRAEADKLTAAAGAARIATLEIEGRYEAALYDAWFEQFSPESFTDEELSLLPVVAAVERATAVADRELASFSRALLSHAPIQILVLESPILNPGVSGSDPFDRARLELGYLGVSHREAFVQQSTPAWPDHLIEGFRVALGSVRPSLHLLATGVELGDRGHRFDPWLEAGAAVESRAHPLFRYDPTAGLTWASRMSFTGNPDPEEDWSADRFVATVGDEEGQVVDATFTFADYVLLDPSFVSHFRIAPDEAGEDDLVPFAAYLELDPEERMRRIPFVWGVDEEDRAHRLAVSRRLVQAGRDRIAYWRTLQELAGVRNEYVREATERARNEAEAEARQARARLEEEHARAIESARIEATEEALGNLARSLLDLPSSGALSLVVGSTPSAAPPTAPGAPAEGPAVEAAPEEAVEEEEEEEPGDPWIATALCTSCNDCTAINPRLFVYDSNKQARIGDPNAGSFEELVRAAEKCPARCIHPGKPRNPDEPNLDALIERAKPFQ